MANLAAVERSKRIVEHAERLLTVVTDEPMKKVGYWLCPVCGTFKAELEVTQPQNVHDNRVVAAWGTRQPDDWASNWKMTHTEWEETLWLLMQRFVYPHMRSCINPPKINPE